MSKINSVFVGLIFLVMSLSCKSFMPAKFANAGRKSPVIDFTAPGTPLNVKVQLDKKQTASGKVSPAGGSVSLTSADGSKFTLDVPANALEKEVKITLTAVKTLDGAPLDKNTPTAVHLEPSGLFFKEMATLTIVPATEIPVKEQIIFGFEGDGKDYHLAVIDHKSKDIKIKLTEFSGAGVGSGSDSAWAANLQIEAETSRTRLDQKIGALLAADRQARLLGNEKGIEGTTEQVGVLMDDFEDQILIKEAVAAELDCQLAHQAIRNLIIAEKRRQLLGLPGIPNFLSRINKLKKIAEECKIATERKKSYRVSGQSNKVNFTGQICGLDQPFVINGTFPGGSAKTSFAPKSVAVGTTTVSGGGNGCSQTGGGSYTVSFNEGNSGTLTWTTTDKLICPGYGNSRTATFTLPLQPASESSCP